MPVLKPNEAMIEEAEALGGTLGLLASFGADAGVDAAGIPGQPAPSCPSWPEGAMAALDRGDTGEHDRLALLAAEELKDCDAIALAQFGAWHG